MAYLSFRSAAVLSICWSVGRARPFKCLTNCHQRTVCAELGWSREEVKSWLFHGTDDVDAVLSAVFKISHANLKHNVYGAGVYFVRRPRLTVALQSKWWLYAGHPHVTNWMHLH